MQQLQSQLSQDLQFLANNKGYNELPFLKKMFFHQLLFLKEKKNYILKAHSFLKLYTVALLFMLAEIMQVNITELTHLLLDG